MIGMVGKTATNKEIVATLFEANNWDGQKIHKDWKMLEYFDDMNRYAYYQ